MRETACVIGPFGDQRRALAIIVEPDFLHFRRVFQPVEIGVRERQAQQVQGNAAVQDKAVSAPRSACADTGSRWNRLRKKDPGCVSSD